MAAELDAGRALDRADRAILTLYVETWAAYRKAADKLARHGPVIKWPNGLPGPSPFYKVAKELAAQLRGLLAELGLTPASRRAAGGGKGDDKPGDAGDLDF